MPEKDDITLFPGMMLAVAYQPTWVVIVAMTIMVSVVVTVVISELRGSR